MDGLPSLTVFAETAFVETPTPEGVVAAGGNVSPTAAAARAPAPVGTLCAEPIPYAHNPAR